MALQISRALLDAILAEGARDPGVEVCGLLMGADLVEAIIPARNLAATPEDSFEIDPATLFAAIRRERTGEQKVIGYYHSHPTGNVRPSERDRAQAVLDGRIWLIISGDSFAAWQLDPAGMFAPVAVTIASEPKLEGGRSPS